MGRFRRRRRMATTSLGRRINPAPEMAVGPERAAGSGVSSSRWSRRTASFIPGVERDTTAATPAGPLRARMGRCRPAVLRRIRGMCRCMCRSSMCGDGCAVPGERGRAKCFSTLDILIAQKRMPVMVGDRDWQRRRRWAGERARPGVRHDVGQVCGVCADRGAAAGGEDGECEADGRSRWARDDGRRARAAAAAMAMAWFHPEWYHRVLTRSGTFVNQQWPHNDAMPHGGWELHEHLIPESPVKPLRIWMEVGDRDNGSADRPEGPNMHDWVAGEREHGEGADRQGLPLPVCLCAQRRAHRPGGARGDPARGAGVYLAGLSGGREEVWRGITTSHFDIVNDFAYKLRLAEPLAAGLALAVARPITLARNGMFGKRGETPPLPRNCERARCSSTHRRGVNASQDFPTEAARRREGKSSDRPACTRVSQETGSAAYSNHVPGGERRSSDMSAVSGRSIGRISLACVCLAQILDARRLPLLSACFCSSRLPARAVVVRGVVTDALGRRSPAPACS